MTDLNDLTKITHKPAGYFLAPKGEERIGDVPNVVFCNGWILDNNGKVYIYYASSDTRLHVATSTLDKLCDYVINTPEDGLSSASSLQTLNAMIDRNKTYLNSIQPVSI
jgi:4-O-beta-D-mannosyl-D-glucose phosphorylase